MVETTTLTRTTAGNPSVLEIDAQVATPLGTTFEQYILSTSSLASDPGARLIYWRNDAGAWRTYSYDLLGNRTSTPSDSFTYNAEGNRLLGAMVEGGAVDYTYDEAGFATSRSGVPITWSAGGQMTSFGDDHASWDMSGRLISLEAGGQLRRFDLFGGAIESDAATGAVGALDLGNVVLHPGTPRREFRHFDFRSDVSFVSDEAGNVVTHYRYQPYGLDAVLGVDGGVHFVHKPALGPLMLLGFRVYDSEVGRFLSPDPILQPLSQYTYTNGNPVRYADASGLGQAENIAGFMLAASAATIAAGAGLVATGAGLLETPAAPLGVALIVKGLDLINLGIAGLELTAGGYIAWKLIDKVMQPPTTPNPRIETPPEPSPGPGGGPGGGSGGGNQTKVITLKVEVEPPAPPPLPPIVSCSPAELSQTPSAAGWLPWLVCVNFALALAWLRAQRKHRRRNG
jgi:RHS repeat-associated protein